MSMGGHVTRLITFIENIGGNVFTEVLLTSHVVTIRKLLGGISSGEVC